MQRGQKTAEVSLREVAAYLDDFLGVATVPDWKNAINGIQVENSGQVHRVAAAVDASEHTIGEAVARGCDLLLVHHGLFWSGNRPVTGSRYRRLRLLLASDVAVYSAHLPLDVHAELGNNALLARRLGLEPDGTFGRYEGRDIGVTASCELELAALKARLENVLNGPTRLIAGGPPQIRRIAIVTGRGGGLVEDAVAAGADTLVTGEGSHHTYVDAMEAGINLLYGGHYATETFGVRALAAHLTERFGIAHEFIDAPTGM